MTPGTRRNFMTTSACGLCGKTSIEDICVLPHATLAADTVRFAPDMLATLPDRLRDAQRGSPAPAGCMPPGCSPQTAT